MSLIHPEDKPKVRLLLMRMDRKTNTSIAQRLHTILKDKEGRDVYLYLNMMPIKDKEGNITHYFGIFRNETEMTYTELKLKEETKKALEEEQLKNTFLLNMSHELRTPLNAVIGFAELFNTDHAEEDETIFAEEIKKNTDILLALINDILFLSRIDAHMIEYNYQQTDFAPLFDGWCYMGWTTLNDNIKANVENPYNELIVNIDPQNLQIAIQKLCYYSCLTTTEGYVNAKYDYRHGELMITIEDTSNGMDAKALQHAFSRFVQE
jgi:signal transduction histidine kinase